METYSQRPSNGLDSWPSKVGSPVCGGCVASLVWSYSYTHPITFLLFAAVTGPLWNESSTLGSLTLAAQGYWPHQEFKKMHHLSYMTMCDRQTIDPEILEYSDGFIAVEIPS